MHPLSDKLECLRAQKERLRARCRDIVAKLVLTLQDRKEFEECLSLIQEIKDYSERLTRIGEKWSIK